jgi:DNA-binding XRE family transcriptional regulator
MSKKGGWEPTGFGGRLKSLREAAGLSQQQLAERAGCNKFTVAKLEAGKQEPAWPLVLAICAALDVTCQAFAAAPSAVPPSVEPAPDPVDTLPAEEKRPRRRKGG